VGHVFKLGTFLSEKLGAYFLDKDGSNKPCIMGCYGIGVGRLLAAAVEQNHDDKGILWPVPIAPYEVYLCALKVEDANVMQAAEKIYSDLTAAGIDVLFDDREESPGVKFNDADLIGIPLRIVVSARTLKNNSVELKWRKEAQAQIQPLDGLMEVVKSMIKLSPNVSP
jgi:prolyl-tRNA synthetase